MQSNVKFPTDVYVDIDMERFPNKFSYYKPMITFNNLSNQN